MTRPGGPGRSGGPRGDRRVLPLVVWIVALGVGTVLFHAMGDGPLSAPPLAPSAWGNWVAGRDPLIATVAVLRLVVLGLSWYLVGATSIGILARLLRAARLVRLADALTVPALRRLLQGALGMSLATAMVASATPHHGLPVRDDPAGPTATITAVHDPTDDAADGATDGAGQVVLASTGAAPAAGDAVTLAPAAGDPAGDPAGDEGGDQDEGEDGEVTLQHVDDPMPVPLDLLESRLDPPGGPGGDGDAADPPPAADDGAENGAEGGGPDVAAEPVVEEADTDRAVAADPAHVVRSGESLWTIARDALSEVSGDQPSDAQVADYWRQVIDTNRDRLADPDNPDLIFPGQELVLPATDGVLR